MKLGFLSKNIGKILAAQSIFSNSFIELVGLEKEYPEIQADSSLEIARYASITAASD